MANTHTKDYASMVFVNIMWGLSFIASKHALNVGFTTMTLVFARYVMAAIFLVAIVLIKEKRLVLHKQDILPMFISGLMGITFYYFFEYMGIQRTTTVNASLILAAIPIFTMGAEAIILRTRLTAKQIIGAFISLAGVGLVVLFGGSDGEHSIVGDLFILGASVVWVAYIFCSRKLREKYSSLSMNAWQALTALCTLLPLSLLESPQWKPIPLDGWLCVLVLASICSAFCYCLYGNALKSLSPLASAIFINIIPLTTIVCGVILLKEPLNLMQAMGGILIVISIFLVNLPSKKISRTKERVMGK